MGVRPALYYPWVYLRGGAERTLVELMSRSRHDWTLYTNRYDPDSTFPEFRSLNVVALSAVSLQRTIGAVGKAALTLLTQRLDLSGHDSLMVVSEGLGNLVALRSTIPTSCICLTPLKVAYDPVTRDRFYDGRWRPHYRLAIRCYCQMEAPAWKRYHRVLCNSEEVRRRVMACGLVDESRLEVVHHGVDLDRFQPGNARDPYFLVPGRIMWQKNIDLALQAWRLFKPAFSDNSFRLVIAGTVDRKSQSYLQHLRDASWDRPDIEFVESPNDQALCDLYQRSTGVVFTAPNEDWGLVPLEAMACGKPVLAARRGGPTESIIHGETGYLVDDTPAEFARAIGVMAGLDTQALDEFSIRARARAGHFSWSRFVSRVDEHVEELAAANALAPSAAGEVAVGRPSVY
jgi:glycosyltransferase involved in cell wall biosynthesis